MTKTKIKKHVRKKATYDFPPNPNIEKEALENLEFHGFNPLDSRENYTPSAEEWLKDNFEDLSYQQRERVLNKFYENDEVD